jgi:predicted RNase H-like HicB family nuclease
MTHVIALIHEEDGVFGVSFPDYPGCISTADTLDDAIRRGREALLFHVEGVIEDGENLPVARGVREIRRDPRLADVLADAIIVAVPLTLPGRAVRLNITLDEHLLAAVDDAAKASGLTRSGFLADAARARLAGG